MDEQNLVLPIVGCRIVDVMKLMLVGSLMKIGVADDRKRDPE